MEELQARHRKEQKELQGKITSKKKNATKKTRKGVNDECERLEQEMKERQQAEVKALALTHLEDETSKLDLNGDEDNVDPVDQTKTDTAGAIKESMGAPNDKQENGDTTISESKPTKQNRQKARLARRAAEQQAQMEAAAEEAANMPDQRQLEMAAMKKQMESRGLTETMIRPDGHCLYSACAHTMSTDKAQDYKAVRLAAADFMTSHPDDFAPFMEEPIQTYTHKIKDTAEWGGHLELQAIAKAFNANVNVLRASGHVDRLEPEEKSEKEIWLAYYKHSFGLGEHYNALKKTSAG
ncbi:OTU protein [Knufia obscura]|uniref:OTU protein n=2 Tax=Knufia TaxID=430999 RepID=A0AAN8IS19_9EURO|nr:OTU protein [Knufia obscura]KAK5957712.1 OTU protein [Knufia fluminis]